jgi:hypothetical protein
MSSAHEARQGWEHCRLTLGFNNANTLVFHAASTNIVGLQSGTSFDECLDRLGKDRWELVTIVDNHHGTNQDERLAYFKRPMR